MLEERIPFSLAQGVGFSFLSFFTHRATIYSLHVTIPSPRRDCGPKLGDLKLELVNF